MLKAMDYQYTFPERLVTSRRKVDTLLNGSQEVKSSKRFAALLIQVVLPVGNVLNKVWHAHAVSGDGEGMMALLVPVDGSQGRRNASASGVKISSLKTLSETKAPNGISVRHFLVSKLLDESPQVRKKGLFHCAVTDLIECQILKLMAEMKHLEAVKELSINDVAKDINDLESNLKSCITAHQKVVAQRKSNQKLLEAGGDSVPAEAKEEGELLAETESRLEEFLTDAKKKVSVSNQT